MGPHGPWCMDSLSNSHDAFVICKFEIINSKFEFTVWDANFTNTFRRKPFRWKPKRTSYPCPYLWWWWGHCSLLLWWRWSLGGGCRRKSDESQCRHFYFLIRLGTCYPMLLWRWYSRRTWIWPRIRKQPTRYTQKFFTWTDLSSQRSSTVFLI